MSLSTPLGKVVSSRWADPLQLWNKHPEIVDPLNLTDAGAIKAQKEYDKQYKQVIARAKTTQADINKRYGLQGNLTILGG